MTSFNFLCDRELYHTVKHSADSFMARSGRSSSVRSSKRIMWVGKFYKLHRSSKISEEVSLQSMIFPSVKYTGFCVFSQ